MAAKKKASAAEPTPEARVAQLTASCNAMEQQLREAGLNVDTGRVNVLDLRVFATAAAALRLLLAKGIVSQADVDLSVLSVLQEFLSGMLVQMEASQDTQRAKRAKPVAVGKGDLIVPASARRPRLARD
jgi:hypothetical protein